jgi:hypothetical protein
MALSCPSSEENFAAIAKQLHQTAVQAEDRIYDLEFQLRAAANRPTIIQVSDTLETGIFAGTMQLIGPRAGVSFVTTFNNTVHNSTNGVANSNDFFPAVGEGVYEVGFTCTAIASGAATADSYRIFRIQHHTADSTSAGTIQVGFRLVDEISHTIVEASTGLGVEVSIAGHFRLLSTDRIFVTLVHNNASNINISIGAKLWAHKASDLTLTAVL